METPWETPVKKSWHQRITVDPEIHHCEPCITGTRIPVRTIVASLAEGLSRQQVIDEFPQLIDDDISAALSFASEMLSAEGPTTSDPEVPRYVCSNWQEIVEQLEEFPAPELHIDGEGEAIHKGWVFRGLKSSCYSLEPSIEREAQGKSLSWFALERMAAFEFRARARMHISANLLPDPEDEFSWLAQMQHYGIPTRLLDFTHSPFVALYFAIRQQSPCLNSSHVRIWAINEEAVRNSFQSVVNKAYRKDRPRLAENHPYELMSMGDAIVHATSGYQETVNRALLATGAYRAVFNKEGCIAVAPPPDSNPRLASQQGVFLANCAEKLTFGESLKRMMSSKEEWCKVFDIPTNAAREIEEMLFQMNIHEQSLFPDLEGLAGLIRQSLRLHWK